MVFPVGMFECESWAIKKAECQGIDTCDLWCWRRLLRICSLDSREIKPVNPKGNKPLTFIGRIDAEVETPILWPLDAKSQVTGKDPNSGKD